MPRIGRLIGIGYLALCLVLLASQMLGGPSFYAPLSFVASPQPDPLMITLAVSPEKAAWLEQAVARFEAGRPMVGRRPIDVQLQTMGMQQMSESLASGQLQATALSPASQAELRLLEQQWQQRHGSPLLAEGNLAPQPLAFTPLVLLAWQDVGDRRWNNDSFDWEALHQAVTANDQGYLKLGHSRPTSAYDGLALLTLLLQHFHGYASGAAAQPADVADSGFQRWLMQFEQGVSVFDESAETLVRNMVLFGPSRYEAVIAYENLAIQYALSGENRWGALRVYYPPANLYSDHPFAVLQGEWISPEQQEAAALLRDYLLSPDSQRLALAAGFRPANAEVSIEGPDSPFARLADSGLRTSIDQLVPEPGVEVSQALRELWTQSVGR